MARLVLTRRSRRWHRLSRLVLQRHVILQRRAPTTMLLRGLGLRPWPGMGRVWRVWPVAEQPLALELPPALEPLQVPVDAPEARPVSHEFFADVPRGPAAAAPIESPAGRVVPPTAQPEAVSAGVSDPAPALSDRARTTAAPTSVPQTSAPPAAPRSPLLERLAGAARTVIGWVTAREPRTTGPEGASRVAPPPAVAEPPPAIPGPPRQAERAPEPGLVPSAEAGAEVAGTHAVAMAVGDAAPPLVVPEALIPEAGAAAEARPPAAEEMELTAEPRGTPVSPVAEAAPAEAERRAAPVAPARPPARPVLTDSNADRPRQEGPLPLVEERSTRAPEVAPAAASRPEGEASPAAAEAPSAHDEAAPVSREDRDTRPASPDVRAPFEPRPVHVAEERRPRRPPPPPPSAPRHAAAPAAPRSPEPEFEPLPDPASLFEQKPDGRSPADWLGRLEAAAQEAVAPANAAAAPAPPARQSTASRPRPAPTPISMSARRFLRPLVGIDPAEVVIYRGAEVAQAAAARGADALARGEEIAVGTAGSEQEPRTLGLLAHELTHVARHRAPRFIPPVVGGTRIPAGTSTDDEEALAGQVEARVRTIAEREADARVHVAPHPATPAATPVVPEWTPAAPVAPIANAAGEPDASRRDWGGLPAPWEPMPDFVGSAPAWTPFQDTGPGAASAGPEATVAVHRAASDRGEDPAVGPAQASPASGEKGQPAPDLDALARQVYTVLRRRIAAERRRDA